MARGIAGPTAASRSRLVRIGARRAIVRHFKLVSFFAKFMDFRFKLRDGPHQFFRRGGMTLLVGLALGEPLGFVNAMVLCEDLSHPVFGELLALLRRNGA
ncbi:MAG: hypothetical protein EA378_06445 [Phycisphaerales bacterium]|nr:MAG: hypothetical protein EA378_06445 [Phycisphaerales bacterium]